MEYPKTLAIDYGTQRIGVAISHASLAEPLTVIANTSDSNDKAIAELVKLLADQQIKQVVVGLSEKEMAQKTKDFVAELKQKTDLPVYFFDETLSSQAVESRLRQKGIKASKRQGPIDHYAAALILEEWLEQT